MSLLNPPTTSLPSTVGYYVGYGLVIYLIIKLITRKNKKEKEWVCDKCEKEYHTKREASKCEKTCQK